MKFKSFEKIENYDKALVRPEFIKITKKGEVQKYEKSAAEGIVEDTAFRGDYIEYTISSNGSTFFARRGLDDARVETGEKVDVFIYRIFVTLGDEVRLLRNESIREETVVI